MFGIGFGGRVEVNTDLRVMKWQQGLIFFMGICNENVSGANRPEKNRYFVNWN
jgi:hypothetical protein